MEVLRALAARDYAFVTPTPSTCRRIHDRPPPARPTLRDIFGWSLPFEPRDLDADLLGLARDAGLIGERDGRLHALCRVSTVHDMLFLHSAFPTTAEDAVFLGPDTYRFADLIAAEVEADPGARIVDIGAGAGVGGLVAARRARTGRAVLTDVNPAALRFAAANAAHAGIDVELVEGEGLEGAPDPLDLIVANPPYIAGSSGRTYKDGGDMHGARMSLDWAVAGMARLAPGGRMVLYTGSPILLGGVDALRNALQNAADKADCTLRYRELDPDIFNSELRKPAYHEVERIAAVAAVIQRPK